MAERSRLEALKEAGRSAWQGLLAAVRGVDVVVEEEQAEQPGVGSAIGRRAMAAAQHRIGGAAVSAEGAAVDAVTLLDGVELSLTVYPSAFPVESVLGLRGLPLPEDGDLETAATACDLAWLPLETGREIFGRVAGARLLAVGGYRRAALVTLAPGGGPVWCCLGEEALGGGEPGLLMERPGALWRAASDGRARRVLAGGALLERLRALPGARVEREVDAPVWGLFSATGRAPALQPFEADGVLLAPVEGE